MMKTVVFLSFPLLGFACASAQSEPVAQHHAGGATPSVTLARTSLLGGEDGGGPAADPCACPTTCLSVADAAAVATCHPAAAPANLPESQEIGSFTIRGYEYWQWKKPDPYAGGDEVAWGYNGDGDPQAVPPVLPTDASRACMAESRRVLEDLLTNDVPPELEAFRAQHNVASFWQWNNDMTDAAVGVEAPPKYQSLWLYNRRLIKWMSHTNRDGSCRLPTRADLVKFAVGCSATFPTCYNSEY